MADLLRKLPVADNYVPLSGKQNRRPTWMRLLDVVLRAAHVLVISILVGGAFFKVPYHALLHWCYLGIATGCALIVSEILHSRHWPYQGRGVMVFIHVALFSLACFQPRLAIPCLIAALIVGMLGSHMPKKFRHWSFIHRQVKD
jgi:hypothetical protein